MSHFLDRLTYFSLPKESFSGDYGVTTGEDRTWEDAYRNRWQHEHAHAVISVTNIGADIAPKHLRHLFDRFYRADASRHNSERNHGLGLAIVKAIAKMHGGSVFAQSQGGATTFGLILPVAPVP